MTPAERVDACEIDGCERRRLARGWCSTHYYRWQHNGDPLVVKRVNGDVPTRFWPKVERGSDDACWPWKASRNPSGYGMVTWGGRQQGAHRVAYELLVGPIPEGLELDHLCRVRECVNPSHLEPVARRTNILRGEGPKAINARKTACGRGHLFDEANTYFTADGRRDCRACWAVRR